MMSPAGRRLILISLQKAVSRFDSSDLRMVFRARRVLLGRRTLVHSAPHTREVNGIRAVCRTPVGGLKAFSVLPGGAVPSPPRSKEPPINAENDMVIAMLFEGGFSFANFLMDVLAVFVFVVWLWLLVTVFGDLLRRQDISGWGKTVWVIFMILAPYIGVLAYLIFL